MSMNLNKTMVSINYYLNGYRQKPKTGSKIKNYIIQNNNKEQPEQVN